MTDNEIVTLRDLYKRFSAGKGLLTALRDINLTFGKGSFVLSVNKHAKRENLLYSTQEELEQVIKKARQAGISKAELAELVAMILEEELG